jgi:predicted glycosyltransferase
MCGYNTALDVLQTGVPAVFVPFDAGGEVEQSLRAKALETQDGIAVLTSYTATPETLLSAVRHVTNAAKRTPATTGFDGAAETMRIVETLLAQRSKR